MNNNTSKICSILLTLCGTLAVSNQLNAEDETAKQLLNSCWSVTKKRDADLLIKNEPNKTANAVWAYTLVKVRQHDVAKAIVAIEALEKIEPKNARTTRLKTWLLLRQSKFDSALISVSDFISLVNSDKKSSKGARERAYEFAGTVFGFLDGPVANRVNRVSRDSALLSVLVKVDVASQTAFDSAYQRVASKYGEIMYAKQEVDKSAAIQDAKVRQAKFEMLTEKEAQLQEAERRIGNERSNFRIAATENLANLQSQQLHLANQRTLFSTRAHLHHTNYDSKKTSSGSMNQRKSHHGKPRFSYGHVYGLHTHRNALDRQFHASRRFAAYQINSLNTELKEVSKAKQRTAGQKLRALKPTTKSDGQAVALRNRATSIKTYAQFPLELERQTLLSSVK